MGIAVRTSTNSRKGRLDVPFKREKVKAKVEAQLLRGLHEAAECSAGIGLMAPASLEVHARRDTIMTRRLLARGGLRPRLNPRVLVLAPLEAQKFLG